MQRFGTAFCSTRSARPTPGPTVPAIGILGRTVEAVVVVVGFIVRVVEFVVRVVGLVVCVVGFIVCVVGFMWRDSLFMWRDRLFIWFSDTLRGPIELPEWLLTAAPLIVEPENSALSSAKNAPQSGMFITRCETWLGSFFLETPLEKRHSSRLTSARFLDRTQFY
jgi:hypothetical protein